MRLTPGPANKHGSGIQLKKEVPRTKTHLDCERDAEKVINEQYSLKILITF